MKVLLIRDVYKLGRAGDVKKVADGYGRNFLLPQGLAVLATPGALKEAEKIKSQAKIRRDQLNSELKILAEMIDGQDLDFAMKAGETGRLYGSITRQDVANALQEKVKFEIKRQQVEMPPIRELGEYTAHVRLTLDLIPKIKVTVHREGEFVQKEGGARQKTRSKKSGGEADSEFDKAIEIVNRLPGDSTIEFPDEEDEEDKE